MWNLALNSGGLEPISEHDSRIHVLGRSPNNCELYNCESTTGGSPFLYQESQQVCKTLLNT